MQRLVFTVVLLLRLTPLLPAKYTDGITITEGEAQLPANHDAKQIDAGRESSQGISFVVGKCTADYYYSRYHRCVLGFYDTFLAYRDQPSYNCSVSYAAMKQCVRNLLHHCVTGSYMKVLVTVGGFLQTIYDNTFLILGDERTWCANGGLEVSRYRYDGEICNPVYPHVVRKCAVSYHKHFRAAATTRWRLCKEYTSAKTCMLRARSHHCSSADFDIKKLLNFLIDVDLQLQPFCTSLMKKSFPMSQRELEAKRECPPRSHSDVVVVADVGSHTSTKQFRQMKDLTRCIATRMDIGISGIRVAVLQFHATVDASIPLTKFDSKLSLVRGLRKMQRMSEQRGPRLTGSSLARHLVRKLTSVGEMKVRPFHIPLVVMLPTDPGADDTGKDEERILSARRISTIKLGPHLPNITAQNVTTINLQPTESYADHCGLVIRKICQADEVVNGPRNQTHIEENILSTPPPTGLANLYNYARRQRQKYYLPLLARPRVVMTMLRDNDESGRSVMRDRSRRSFKKNT